MTREQTELLRTTRSRLTLSDAFRVMEMTVAANLACDPFLVRENPTNAEIREYLRHSNAPHANAEMRRIERSA